MTNDLSVQDSALRDPAGSTARRRPGSARRTSHIDMRPVGESSQEGLELHGGARDLLTPPEGASRVVAEASLAASLGPGRVLRRLDVRPDRPSLRQLEGNVVGRGFRTLADGAVPQEAAAQTPLHLLVDDLPVAALISGYADLYTRPTTVSSGAVPADVCAGWSSDGSMMRIIDTEGVFPIPVGPAAPVLGVDDPTGWHELPALEAGAMRRRRLVDVEPGAGTGTGLGVHAMFRDSHLGADGVERVLHEYELEAAVDIDTGTFTRCVATPRVLPWLECPFAAASAEALVGRSVGEARAYVRENLRGLSTCTHLNDLLRSLGDVVPLATALCIDLNYTPNG